MTKMYYVKYPGASLWTKVQEREYEVSRRYIEKMTSEQPEFCMAHPDRMPAVKFVAAE
jgi:hypothetical protein